MYVLWKEDQRLASVVPMVVDLCERHFLLSFCTEWDALEKIVQIEIGNENFWDVVGMEERWQEAFLKQCFQR